MGFVNDLNSVLLSILNLVLRTENVNILGVNARVVDRPHWIVLQFCIILHVFQINVKEGVSAITSNRV